MSYQDKKIKAFLLISNHRSPKGIRQQKDIIKRSFERINEYELIETNNIIPNQLNIIIEELDIDLVNFLIKIKKNHKETKLVIFVTEYLVQSFFGKQLNTFDIETKISHLYLTKCLIIPFLNFIKVKNNFEKFKRGFLLRKLIMKIIIYPLSLILDRDGLANAINISRREYCLKKAKNLFDLCISNSAPVNNSYKKFFNCEIILLPTYIDKTKSIKARKNFLKLNKKYIPGMFFSGRLTKYRKKLLSKFWYINSLYPTEALLSYQSSIDNFKNEKLKEIPLYEIYIKQEKNWPYSSPMRTLLSIEEGFIPINVGHFNDHTLNKLAINISPNATKEELCSFLLNIDVNEAFKSLDILIEDHNKAEDILIDDFCLVLNNLNNQQKFL